MFQNLSVAFHDFPFRLDANVAFVVCLIQVVLREHFRCAPEIINFSNELFYDDRLIPLRLPTSSERLNPSLMDVRVKGTKDGKVNEKECDTIVEMIQDFVRKSDSDTFPRSIGVISLMGDEQSRLIRGRLLDALGPQKYKEHDMLVGDPPTFQGAERDIIFLSMVCSPGRVPTQSQLMYAQRANVALSRARDRMVLVRSIDGSHIPSGDDIKLPIIEFFSGAANDDDENDDNEPVPKLKDGGLFSFRLQAQSLLERMLRSKGYSVRSMGIVWNDAICVEDKESGTRAAVCLECAGETMEEWSRLVKQQKSIERVGWKTFRVDGLSFLVDCPAMFKSVEKFLRDVAVEPLHEEEVIEQIEEVELDDIAEEEEAVPIDLEPGAAINDDEIVVISSEGEDDDSSLEGKRNRGIQAVEEVDVKVEDDNVDPSQYGDVANLAFLRGSEDFEDEADIVDDPYHPDGGSRSRKTRRTEPINVDSGNDDSSDGSDDDYQQPKTGIATGVARAPSGGVDDDFAQGSDGPRKAGRSMNDGNAAGVAQAPSDEMDDDVPKGSDTDARKKSRLKVDTGNDVDVARAPSNEDTSDLSEDSGSSRARKRQRRTRLDKYSRDGRWYPGKYKEKEDDDDEKKWYDTDSDLPSASSKPTAQDSEWRPDANAESDDEMPL